MSGIESAGIVLAVIPLVLKSLKSYSKRSHKTKGFMQAAQERRSFARKLRQLNSELRSFILELVTPVIPLLTLDQRQGLTDPDIGGAKFFDLWNDIVNTNPGVIEDAFA